MVGSRYTSNGTDSTGFTRHNNVGKNLDSNSVHLRTDNSSVGTDDSRNIENGSEKKVWRGVEERRSFRTKRYDLSSICSKLGFDGNILLRRFNSIFQLHKTSSKRSVWGYVQKVAPYAVLATVGTLLIGADVAHANPIDDYYNMKSFLTGQPSPVPTKSSFQQMMEGFQNIQNWMNDPFGFGKGVENLQEVYQKEGNIEVFNEIKSWAMNDKMPLWIQNMGVWFLGWLVRGTQHLLYDVFTNLFWVLTKVLLYIPTFLFNGAWIGKSVITFTIISLIATLVWATCQGVKRMLKMDYTPLSRIIKRFPVSMIASASVPFLSSKAGDAVNSITSKIVEISMSQVEYMNADSFTIKTLSFMPISIILMVVFFIVLAGLVKPMFLQNGKRWFDFLLLIFVSPFALSAYIFKDTEKYFKAWWNKVKDSFMIQIFNAFILSIMGLIIFATPAPSSIVDMTTKTLLMVGSLYYLAFPPSIIGKLTDGNGDGILSMYKKSKEVVKSNFKPMGTTTSWLMGKLASKTPASWNYKKLK